MRSQKKRSVIGKKLYDILYDIWYPIREFFKSIWRIITWIPLLWKLRPWDNNGIYKILIKNITDMEVYMSEKGSKIIEYWEEESKSMKVVIELLKRVDDEFYNLEYLDYHEFAILWTEFEEKRGNKMEKFYKFESEITEHKFLEYFKLYPNEYRKAKLKTNRVGEEFTPKECENIAFHMSMSLHEKAKRVLFNYMSYKIPGWWV